LYNYRSECLFNTDKSLGFSSRFGFSGRKKRRDRLPPVHQGDGESVRLGHGPLQDHEGHGDDDAHSVISDMPADDEGHHGDEEHEAPAHAPVEDEGEEPPPDYNP
jgi:hypothetical protein